MSPEEMLRSMIPFSAPIEMFQIEDCILKDGDVIVKWWVYRSGRAVGWVIAADAVAAKRLAAEKYPEDWNDTNEIQQALRKRQRPDVAEGFSAALKRLRRGIDRHRQDHCTRSSIG